MLLTVAYYTTSAVNLRSWPSVAANNVVRSLPAGTNVSINETMLAYDGGKTWVYCTATIGGAILNGWLVADYLRA